MSFVYLQSNSSYSFVIRFQMLFNNKYAILLKLFMMGCNKRSYILKETEVFSYGSIVGFASTQRVNNNLCILTLWVFQILMYVFSVVVVINLLCTCTECYHIYEWYCKACWQMVCHETQPYIFIFKLFSYKPATWTFQKVPLSN